MALRWLPSPTQGVSCLWKTSNSWNQSFSSGREGWSSGERRFWLRWELGLPCSEAANLEPWEARGWAMAGQAFEGCSASRPWPPLLPAPTLVPRPPSRAGLAMAKQLWSWFSMWRRKVQVPSLQQAEQRPETMLVPSQGSALAILQQSSWSPTLFPPPLLLKKLPKVLRPFHSEYVAFWKLSQGRESVSCLAPPHGSLVCWTLAKVNEIMLGYLWCVKSWTSEEY